MKKKFLRWMLLAIACVQIAGCGTGNGQSQTQESTEQAGAVTATEDATDESAQTGTEEAPVETIYFEDINIDDYVTLGEYKGLQVIQSKPEVTQQEVDDFIQYTLSVSRHTVPVTDRDVVQNGDVANIDYEGKKDGVAFEGGTAAGYDLEIGSGSFIPGFEEGLVGAKVGETKDLTLTFPENYQAADLAGQEVVFTVTVNSISTYHEHELNDEFVKELGIEGVTNVKEFEDYAKEGLRQQAENEYIYNVQMQLMTLAMQNATIKEPPAELIAKHKSMNISQAEYQAAIYGMDMETFVQGYYGVDMETFDTQMESRATDTAKQALLCYKIALEEEIEITEEEMNADFEEKYASMGYASADDLKAAVDIKEYKDSMLLDKVVNFLVDNAAITNDVKSLQ